MAELTPEAIEARRQYKRLWNRANKAKVKEYQARYWQKKAKEMQEQEQQEA